MIRLVRYHRKGTPSWGSLSGLAEPGDKRRLLILTTCLRLAEYLERARGGRIQDVKAKLSRTKVKLRLEASEAPFVEMWETRKQEPLFRRAFKRKLQLEAPPWSIPDRR